MKRKIEILFIILLIFLFSFAVFKALKWKIFASLFPFIIGFPMIALALIQMFSTVRAKEALGAVKISAHNPLELDDPLGRRRAFFVILWIVGLLFAVYALGFSLSVILFTFLYLVTESKEKLWFALLLSAVSWIFFYGFFAWALRLPFPKGLVFRLLT